MVCLSEKTKGAQSTQRFIKWHRHSGRGETELTGVSKALPLMPENVTSHINNKDMQIPTQVLLSWLYIWVSCFSCDSMRLLHWNNCLLFAGVLYSYSKSMHRHRDFFRSRARHQLLSALVAGWQTFHFRFNLVSAVFCSSASLSLSPRTRRSSADCVAPPSA